ncbi:MAG: hypothetical protein ACYS5V_12770 [Planctomycetota bacterium]|jgi:hypothetical protein
MDLFLGKPLALWAEINKRLDLEKGFTWDSIMKDILRENRELRSENSQLMSDNATMKVVREEQEEFIKDLGEQIVDLEKEIQDVLVPELEKCNKHICFLSGDER